LIFFIAGLPRRRRGFADAFTSCKATRCARGQRVTGDSGSVHGRSHCAVDRHPKPGSRWRPFLFTLRLRPS
jgi:hypothetical protein